MTRLAILLPAMTVVALIAMAINVEWTTVTSTPR